MNTGLVEPPKALGREESLSLVASFPSWYHRIYLGNGVWTLPGRGFHEDVWAQFSKALPPDLGGRSVLDVGCNAGYFAIEAKHRGAGQVVGIEFVDMFLQQARRLREIWDVDVDYRQGDAHSITGLGQQFNLVVFAGVLYHLKNPLQVLEDLGRICDDAILVETEAIPEDPRNGVIVRQGIPAVSQFKRTGIMAFVERDELNGDGSNWWIPDTECVKGMLRTAGFVHLSKPVFLQPTRLCMVASKRPDSMLNLAAF
ncbi:MAG: class I SAM-dependent methyltransferase [Acidobacteriota bacterium]